MIRSSSSPSSIPTCSTCSAWTPSRWAAASRWKTSGGPSGCCRTGTPCLMPAWALPERQPGRWVLRSDSGRIIAQMPDGALYFEQTYWPWLDHAPDFDDLEGAFKESMWTNVASPPGPITAGPDGDRILVEGAQRLRASTDRAIIGLFGGNLLEIGQFLFRNDELLRAAGERAGQSRRVSGSADRASPARTWSTSWASSGRTST